MANSPAALIRLARPRQWVKNAFVAAPLFFTPEAVTWANVELILLAVACFCLLSSAVYVVNDWCDREADRAHPAKRERPLASGAVTPAVGLAYAALLAVVAAGLAAAFLPRAFLGYGAAYAILSFLYSARLKHIAVLDVMIVSGGFVLRVLAGAAAAGISATAWIVVCTFLLALFIALGKRRDDLVRAMSDSHRPSLTGYNIRFVDTALGVTLAALVVSYLIYTTTESVILKFGTDKLYLTAPFVIAGVLRYLQIALVEERSGSPTDLALGDKFLIFSVLGWIAAFSLLIYGRWP